MHIEINAPPLNAPWGGCVYFWRFAHHGGGVRLLIWIFENLKLGVRLFLKICTLLKQGGVRLLRGGVYFYIGSIWFTLWQLMLKPIRYTDIYCLMTHLGGAVKAHFHDVSIMYCQFLVSKWEIWGQKTPEMSELGSLLFNACLLFEIGWVVLKLQSLKVCNKTR